MVDRLEERDRLPAAPRVGIPLLAHLEREHEVQLRQPRLAGALSREQHRPPRLRRGPDLRRERAEPADPVVPAADRSEEHTSELQSLAYLVCRLLLEKKKRLAKCQV